MEKRCRNYVGVACIDGTCPKANAEEYEERCIPVIKNCRDCYFIEDVMIVLYLGLNTAIDVKAN